MEFSSQKKIISTVLIVVFIAQSILLFSNTPKVHAAVPVLEQRGSLLNKTVNIDATTIKHEMKYSKKETGPLNLDRISWKAADMAIEEVTISTLNWINSGFEGGPLYVTDFGGFLRDIADERIGSFIEGSALAFLCDPLDIKFSLALRHAVPFEKEVECTLSDVVDNIEDFIAGDFGSGGWDGWFELTTKPQNNRYGAYLSSAAELEARIQFSQYEEAQVLEFGEGFFSDEKCEEGPQPKGGGPGAPINCEIVTPGSVIETQLNNALFSGQRRLEVSDEFNEIVYALFGQLLKRMFGGWQEGLRGLSEGSSGRPSYVESLRNDDTVDLRGMKEDLIVEIDAEIQKEINYKNIKQSTLNSVLASETLLQQLTSCYEDKITAGSLSIDNKTIAQQRIDNASTTIAMQITPTKALLENDIVASNQNLTTLNTLRSDVSDVTALSQIEVLTKDLFEMQINGTFNGGNIFLAQEEQGIITAQMSTLNSTTQTQITECQVFPPPPIPSAI